MYVDPSPDEDKRSATRRHAYGAGPRRQSSCCCWSTVLATPIFEWATRGASALFGVGV
ncbi:MAG: hypothetical protein U0703_11135 [Anaerolineae bacterium]